MHENIHISIKGEKSVQGTKQRFEKLRVGIVGYNQTPDVTEIYITLMVVMGRSLQSTRGC